MTPLVIRITPIPIVIIQIIILLFHFFTNSAISPSWIIPIISPKCYIWIISPSFLSVLAFPRYSPRMTICISYPHRVLFPLNSFRNWLSTVRRYDGKFPRNPRPSTQHPECVAHSTGMVCLVISFLNWYVLTMILATNAFINRLDDKPFPASATSFFSDKHPNKPSVAQ